MRVTFNSNKTDNVMAKKKRPKQNKLRAVVVTILIVIKIVYKPLVFCKIRLQNVVIYRF